jgi:hypothetical protein
MRHGMSNPPAQPRSWQEMDAWVRDMLVKRTGEDVAAWNAKVAALNPADEATLRAWLTERGVTGYPAMLLVMERFGYPDYLKRSADELLDGQYADRPQLRPIHDALLASLPGLGEVEVQNRKTYVALLTPRRTFASIEPRTKSRVDLGLRLSKDQREEGRLVIATSMGQSGVTHRIGLPTVGDVDDEVRGWLKRAYDANV